MRQAHDFIEEATVLAELLENQPDSVFETVTLFKSWTVNDVVNAGPKLHRTPERKCTIWLDLAGVKLRQLVGFRFVHGPARRSAPTKQRSCAGLWSNRGAVFAL